ncbi:MAG TPA: hypothetical protein PKD09_10510 [Aggregatilinea sp.]|uniref:hypothetical protein n=1 Tax=Aggregatilinea sp. TaxID=2806333 RepID=UPI002C0E1F9F|nr:hypothetical protein [Aggregatilinea sp.]HML22074.1 hypothetical protein [Aggregatilinea sp.]
MPPIAPPPNLQLRLDCLLDVLSPEEIIEALVNQCVEQGERIEVLVLAVQGIGDEANRLLAARERTLRHAVTYRKKLAVLKQLLAIVDQLLRSIVDILPEDQADLEAQAQPDLDEHHG